MQSYSVTIHKLQTAINLHFQQKILINKTQFYSESQNRPITVWVVQKVVPDESSRNGKQRYVKLFQSSSQVQILLFMRDMWYELNGWELPTNDEDWNKVRQKIKEQEDG